MSRSASRVLNRIERGAEAAAAEVLHQVSAIRAASLLSGPIVFAALWILAGPGDTIDLDEPAARMLAIFGLTAVYWSVGAFPAFATGLLATGLMVFLVGIPADGTDAPSNTGVSSWTQFIDVAATPVIVLMLGGFVIGAAIHKHRLDRLLAVKLIKPFAGSGGTLILGILIVTAVLSMWTSNTATAAMMIALVSPIIAQLPREAGKPIGTAAAAAMAVAVGANVGGIATPIGTPPNAIAFGIMNSEGVPISFLGWMAYGLPVAAVMLLLAWATLVAVFRVHGQRNKLREIDWTAPAITWNLTTVALVIITLATITLWLTGPWTGLPVAAVALIPLIAFAATGVLDRHDINALDWDILILIASGLALGKGMELTGLAHAAVNVIPNQGLGPVALAVALAAVTLVLSTFMSNTAVANMVVPIAVGMTGVVAGLGITGLVIPIAIAASLAMALPVSTPPNAIVYARSELGIKPFIVIGTIIGLVGMAGVAALAATINAINP